MKFHYSVEMPDIGTKFKDKFGITWEVVGFDNKNEPVLKSKEYGYGFWNNGIDLNALPTNRI